MATLKEYGLDKKLKRVEKEDLPTLEEIKKEDSLLKEKEEAFEKKFIKKKHGKGKKRR